MKTMMFGASVLALSLALVMPASAAVTPNTGAATQGCGPMRVAILGSHIDDLRGDLERMQAQQLLAKANMEQNVMQVAQCEQTLDVLTNLLRHAQVLAQ